MLVVLSYRASADPFAKVRGMIKAMIAKVLQVAAAEATQEVSCVEQLGAPKSRRLTRKRAL